MSVSQPVSRFSVRVYYEDTDVSGVVYHANYLRYFERARTEWLRDRGFDQERLRKELNLAFTVVSAELRFRLPARLDDELLVESRLEKLKAVSFDFDQQLGCESRLLVTGRFRCACIDAEQFKPRALPEFMRKEFA
ncbi:MAG: tol-pal system-associated acyl-CoA thioesterase [Salinisphaeraceae bacterium]|nr:tol-pal system-associated acyl-CoA thioesterase [Salinisphaeraceae bacterium]